MKHLSITVFLVAVAWAVVGQNVGIGITTPQTALHIQSTGTAIVRTETTALGQEAGVELKTNGGVLDVLELRKWPNSTAGNFAGVPLAGLSTITVGEHASGGLVMGTKNSQRVQFITSNAVRMQIDPVGRVGIGTQNSGVYLMATSSDTYNGIYAFSARPPAGSITTAITGNVPILAGTGVGVLGQVNTPSGSSSSILEGSYGVVGTSITQGYGVGAFAVNNANGILAQIISGSGKALTTVGPVQLRNIGESAGRVLTSDALGNATWQNAAETHNHLGQSWSGTQDLGLSITTNSPNAVPTTTLQIENASTLAGAKIAIRGAVYSSIGSAIYGTNFIPGGGEIGAFFSGTAITGNTNSGIGVFGSSRTGTSVFGYKGSSGGGRAGLFANANTSNTLPVLHVANDGTNNITPLLELENGFIKVSGTNRTAFKHTTTAANISANFSRLNYAGASANDIVIVTHNYSPNFTYFNYNHGVFWTGAEWAIYIEKNSVADPSIPMPTNITFNVIVIKQ